VFDPTRQTTVALDVVGALLSLADAHAPRAPSELDELVRPRLDGGLAVKAVTIEATDAHPGMRIDLTIAAPSPDDAARVVLPAGAHVLVARRGRPAQLVARNLRRAAADLRRRLAAARSIAAERDRRLDVELRLVVARVRRPAVHDFHLVTIPGGDGAMLRILTFDAATLY
jgi:putative intracellular protease/amidase